MNDYTQENISPLGASLCNSFIELCNNPVMSLGNLDENEIQHSIHDLFPKKSNHLLRKYNVLDVEDLQTYNESYPTVFVFDLFCEYYAPAFLNVDMFNFFDPEVPNIAFKQLSIWSAAHNICCEYDTEDLVFSKRSKISGMNSDA